MTHGEGHARFRLTEPAIRSAGYGPVNEPAQGSGQTPGWALQPPKLSTCLLCGETSERVAHALIRWRSGDPFGSGPRCPDAGACWQRVMRRGDEWLVADGQPASLPRRDAAETTPIAGPTPLDEPWPGLDFGTAPEEPS